MSQPAEPSIATMDNPSEHRDAKRSHADRRATVRIVRHAPASAIALGRLDTLVRWAIIKDESAEGVGILAPRLYEPGTVLLIWTEGGTEPTPILAKVVHTRPESRGIFHGRKKYVETDITG